MSRSNRANLYEPISALRVGPPPITIRAVITPNAEEIGGGVPEFSTRVETYVLFSALPDELKERVKTAVQALISGM